LVFKASQEFQQLFAKELNVASGSTFERKIARDLSLWWTGGKRDDIFYRSHGSGGRATMRRRRTEGHYGDICTTDKSGNTLIDLLCIELKKGYSKHSIADLLDRPLNDKHIQQKHDEFFQQTLTAWEKSGSFSWLIVQQRKMRAAIAYLPWNLYLKLKDCGCFDQRPIPYAMFEVDIVFRVKKTRKSKQFKGVRKRIKFVVLTITNLLDSVSPDVLKQIAREV